MNRHSLLRISALLLFALIPIGCGASEPPRFIPASDAEPRPTPGGDREPDRGIPRNIPTH